MSLVEMPTQHPVLSEASARELTDTIKSTVKIVDSQITRAYFGRAWSALGYETWDDYCESEFDGAKIKMPREERQTMVASLRESGMSIRAIASAAGIDSKTVQSDLTSGVGNSHTSNDNRPPADVIHDAIDSLDEWAKQLPDDPSVIGEAVAAPDPDADVVDAEIVDLGPIEHKPEPVKTVTGKDGKKYSSKKSKPAPRRSSLTAAAEKAGWELRKATERIERIVKDDRFSANQEQVAASLHSHLLYAIEVCQDLSSQLHRS